MPMNSWSARDGAGASDAATGAHAMTPMSAAWNTRSPSSTSRRVPYRRSPVSKSRTNAAVPSIA